MIAYEPACEEFGGDGTQPVVTVGEILHPTTLLLGHEPKRIADVAFSEGAYVDDIVFYVKIGHMSDEIK